MELNQNGKYTMFEISNMMACTIRREIKVVRFNEEENILFFKEGRKKTVHSRKIEKDMALFHSWDLPFVADFDTGNFQGNAMVNLVGKIDEIKDWFGTKQLNHTFEKYKLTWRGTKEDPRNSHLVYPELAEEERSGHAVIDSMIENGN